MVADITTQPQIVARTPGFPGEGHSEIDVDAALVKLVEDDGAESREQRILLETRGENAFGRDEQAGVGAEAPLEPDLPADLATDRPRRARRQSGVQSARAAARRGCRSSTGPASGSAGGTRVVLPAPGSATTTAARRRCNAAAISEMNASIGSGFNGSRAFSSDPG